MFASLVIGILFSYLKAEQLFARGWSNIQDQGLPWLFVTYSWKSWLQIRKSVLLPGHIKVTFLTEDFQERRLPTALCLSAIPALMQ